MQNFDMDSGNNNPRFAEMEDGIVDDLNKALDWGIDRILNPRKKNIPIITFPKKYFKCETCGRVIWARYPNKQRVTVLECPNCDFEEKNYNWVALCLACNGKGCDDCNHTGFVDMD